MLLTGPRSSLSHAVVFMDWAYRLCEPYVTVHCCPLKQPVVLSLQEMGGTETSEPVAKRPKTGLGGSSARKSAAGGGEFRPSALSQPARGRGRLHGGSVRVLSSLVPPPAAAPPSSYAPLGASVTARPAMPSEADVLVKLEESQRIMAKLAELRSEVAAGEAREASLVDGSGRLVPEREYLLRMECDRLSMEVSALEDASTVRRAELQRLQDMKAELEARLAAPSGGLSSETSLTGAEGAEVLALRLKEGILEGTGHVSARLAEFIDFVKSSLGHTESVREGVADAGKHSGETAGFKSKMSGEG